MPREVFCRHNSDSSTLPLQLFNVVKVHEIEIYGRGAYNGIIMTKTMEHNSIICRLSDHEIRQPFFNGRRLVNVRQNTSLLRTGLVYRTLDFCGVLRLKELTPAQEMTVEELWKVLVNPNDKQSPWCT